MRMWIGIGLKRLFNLNYLNELEIYQIKIVNLQHDINKPVRVSSEKLNIIVISALSGGHLGYLEECVPSMETFAQSDSACPTNSINN
jgi:hypothetical protein